MYDNYSFKFTNKFIFNNFLYFCYVKLQFIKNVIIFYINLKSIYRVYMNIIMYKFSKKTILKYYRNMR